MTTRLCSSQARDLAALARQRRGSRTCFEQKVNITTTERLEPGCTTPSITPCQQKANISNSPGAKLASEKRLTERLLE